MEEYPYDKRELKLIKDAGIILPTDRNFIPSQDCGKKCGEKCYGGAHKLSALLGHDLPCKLNAGKKGLMSSTIDSGIGA